MDIKTIPQLSEEDINAYKNLYKKHFGVGLNMSDANNQANQLVRLTALAIANQKGRKTQ